jgi:tight adherence protein C
MIAKIILPVVFSFLALLFTSKADDLEGIIRLGIVFAAAGAGWFLPGVVIKNTTIKRQEEINLVFPDALDMVLVCVQGGISIEQSIARIADEITDQSAILAEELELLSAELGLLSDKKQAFTDFAERVGSGAAKSFGQAMVQAEKYGTSISQALRVMSSELREMRMSKAEETAAALPPKLTVPMILFFLPPLFVFILGPAVIQFQT